MALLALKKYGFSKEQALMIGDRIYTDIACGINAGISSLLTAAFHKCDQRSHSSYEILISPAGQTGFSMKRIKDGRHRNHG